MTSKWLLMRFASLLFAALLVGCGGKSVNLLKDSEETELLKQFRTGNYVLIAKDELNKLKKGQAIGRYQIKDMGVRTWRFDTALGRVCLLLSSEDDWKKEKTQNQSCAEVDLREA